MSTASKPGPKRSPRTPTVTDLSEQIAILKDDISALTTTVGEVGKAQAVGVAESAKAAAVDLSETGKQAVSETQQKAEDFIRTQPMAALGIAAGLGLLVGIAASRR